MQYIVAIIVIVIAVFFVSAGGPLNKSQIRALAQNAGWEGSDLDIATAVAMAESGGNPHAYNPEIAANTPQGQGSFGLWQIYLREHPEFFNHALYDPQVNANDAFVVYTAAGNSFKPWSTYKNGAYEAYL